MNNTRPMVISPRHPYGQRTLSPVLIVEDRGTLRPPHRDNDSRIYDSVDGPPSLSYPIATKKRSIVLTWSIIVFINTILPTILFYVLHHVVHSSVDFIINIAQIPMTLTVLQFPWRLYQLKRRNGERSPRSRGPLTWDFFQWQFLLGALLTTAVYVIAGAMKSFEMIALAPAILFSEVCLQLLLFDLMASYRIRQPCRISSVPKGSPFRPAVYYIIEDLTAVDGAGCTAYRDRLAVRWDVSPLFRMLVRDVGRICGFSGLLMVSIEVGLILTTGASLHFGASWAILWAWAGVVTYACVKYTQHCLRWEREWWREEYKPA